VPSVSPVVVSGLVDPEAMSPPGDEVTVYELIAAPPSLAGALKLTVACPSPALADTEVGGPGS
jgi:hypothetical protein